MAGSVNKVILVGNLGKDPESRTFQNGGEVVSFSVATSESWKDRNSGERKEKTEWHNVSIFSEGLTRVAKSYLRKGSKVYLEGQLETRKWQDQSGNDRYSTDVVLRNYNSAMVLLDSRDSSGGGRGAFNEEYDDFGGGGGGGGGSTRTQSRPQPAAFDTDLDDDVPF
jgi:single-strand DNA-binding protein